MALVHHWGGVDSHHLKVTKETLVIVALAITLVLPFFFHWRRLRKQGLTKRSLVLGEPNLDLALAPLVILLIAISIAIAFTRSLVFGLTALVSG